MTEYQGEHEGEAAEEIVLPEQETTEVGPPPVFSNALYDKLKWVAQILLPAVASLYFGLAQLWEWPKASEVVGSITIVDFFLGALLGISSAKYMRRAEGRMMGFIDVQTDSDGDLTKAQLNFPGSPHDIVKHDKVTFKVRRQ